MTCIIDYFAYGHLVYKWQIHSIFLVVIWHLKQDWSSCSCLSAGEYVAKNDKKNTHDYPYHRYHHYCFVRIICIYSVSRLPGLPTVCNHKLMLLRPSCMYSSYNCSHQCKAFGILQLKQKQTTFLCFRLSYDLAQRLGQLCLGQHLNLTSKLDTQNRMLNNKKLFCFKIHRWFI